jgi:hypothetical protein
MKKHTLRFTLAAASALSVSIASQLQAAHMFPVEVVVAFGRIRQGGSLVIHLQVILTLSSAIPRSITGALELRTMTLMQMETAGVTTPATPFTAAMGVVREALSVANGNLDHHDTGSVLTQTTLPHEIRIGEGAGAVSGVGTMTVGYGGQFFSGSAVGVAVGSDLNYAAWVLEQ